MNFSKLFLPVFMLSLFTFHTTQAQKDGGIYYFVFTLEKKMVEHVEVERKDAKILSGYSESLDIPESITDSIKSITEKALSDKLKADVKLVYATTEKGKTYKTTFANGGAEKDCLEDFPFATFKKVASQHKLDIYVEIQVSIEDGRAVTVDIGLNTSKLKPMIEMSVKAYNRDKKVIWENQVKLKKFGKLKQNTEEDISIKVRTGETLTPEMILSMYLQALEEIVQG